MNPEVAKIIKRDDVLQLIDDGNISAVLSKIEKEYPLLQSRGNLQTIYFMRNDFTGNDWLFS